MVKRIVVTDCGSTTTKALLFGKTEDGWRTLARGEAPTTVERPLSDVTIGAVNAFSELEELAHRKLLRDDLSDGEAPFIQPGDDTAGIDLYLSTSSAGGGLQMIVLGVVSSMSTESAERAALGAGAIVMDSVAIDDGREQHEHVERIRHLKPDISLIAGGTDGGTTIHPVLLAETLLQADPKPRFGETLKLPVIYAANRDARAEVETILGKHYDVTFVDNIRPSLEQENLAPARDAIHELFLHHVMSHAPGYRKLLQWSPVPVMPTPAAVGRIVQDTSAREQLSILAVDIGGATTDVFSSIRTGEREYVFNRTVSANLGMSYSIGNVLLEAGVQQIKRWLPFEMDDGELTDRIRNKMIRPTSIPQTLDDLLIEQAVCREALRLSLIHHRRLASGLKGTKSKRTIGDLFNQGDDRGFSIGTIDLIIGSGGVLSHAPERHSTALMLLDAFEPEGVTELAVDSIFMMPHLGVLSEVEPEAAAQIFHRDCLVPIATSLSPFGNFKLGEEVIRVNYQGDSLIIRGGEIRSIHHGGEITVTPLVRTVDLGNGAGVSITLTPKHTLILDCRGRPLPAPSSPSTVLKTMSALSLRTP